jgi:hypothetical protein
VEICRVYRPRDPGKTPLFGLLDSLYDRVSGEWIPVPYVDEAAAEKLFRHKVLAFLRRRGLLSQERIELLLSWR